MGYVNFLEGNDWGVTNYILTNWDDPSSIATPPLSFLTYFEAPSIQLRATHRDATALYPQPWHWEWKPWGGCKVEILLMEESLHQLRLVVYPIKFQGFVHVGWCTIFFHQEYFRNAQPQDISLVFFMQTCTSISKGMKFYPSLDLRNFPTSYLWTSDQPFNLGVQSVNKSTH